MTQALGKTAWIKAEATQAVLAALIAVGGPDCVRFVGGCVRNALIGKVTDDIDLATILTPPEVVSALEQAGLKAIPTGIEHGTVTALSAGKTFEITTLRKDVETDGRHALVAFTEDWAEDAARRDFTMNALYADRDGAVFDPSGRGYDDALAGRLVFVGDPDTRIAEDYLRILRYFRFLAWYGKGQPDAAALAACAAGRARLADCSAERVNKEVLKLLGADDPRPALRLMAASGVLGQVLPQAQGLAALERLVAIEDEQLFENDPLLRLAALFPQTAEAGEAVGRSLRLSNAQRERLAAALGTQPRLVSFMSPREARRALYALGKACFRDRVKLAWAHSERPATTPQWRGLIALGEGWSVPTFPLTGKDVVAAGVPAGPLVGQALKEVEDWWIDSDFIMDGLSLIERLKAVVQGIAY
jgi:poly(A) polymerase